MSINYYISRYLRRSCEIVNLLQVGKDVVPDPPARQEGSLWAVDAFATAIFVLYSAFGLFKSTWKMTVAMAICGLIIGGLSFLTNRSLDAFWQTLLRMILLGLCAVPMVSTSPCDLTRCLAKLKCPRVITLGMLVTLKFIPVLVGEIKQIWEAMKVRGANMNWYRPSCIYRAFIIPLVMRIIGISDTLSLSLETRAFTLDDSTSSVYKVIKIKARDFVFLACVIVLCAGGGVMIWA